MSEMRQRNIPSYCCCNHLVILGSYISKFLHYFLDDISEKKMISVPIRSDHGIFLIEVFSCGVVNRYPSFHHQHVRLPLEKDVMF